MSEELLKIIRGKDIIVPYILLKNYKSLAIDEKELLFLSYFYSNDDLIVFNINKFSNDLGFSIDDIMMMLSHLSEIKLLDIIVKKDEHNIRKEYIDLTFLYSKLFNLVIDNNNNNISNDNENSLIYEKIEKEFGRTLSPIEYETIKQWLDSSISEELILEALKEAVLNGVNNLKYIDKILYEWNKKGYKKKKDIKGKKEELQEEKIFDYDWLKENE